ncbi:molybdate-binding protein [Polaromonas sp. CG_23.6]|nr:molybdate-binding protein [Polaromonas sp. CG_23.6]
MVARHNPLQIEGLADLALPGMRYVNRSEGTGTRVLLDDLLAEAGLAPSAIEGYDSQEPSHTAVAQAIASGAADAGLGIEAAAREKGLGFVPLVQERYHLVCLNSELPTPQVQALIKELQSDEWQTTLNQLPGYSGAQAGSGKVLSLRALLPWWSYRKAKAA